MRHSSAGCLGLEQRIERNVVAHPAADAQVVQIGSSALSEVESDHQFSTIPTSARLAHTVTR
jgi:hypothetical protein